MWKHRIMSAGLVPGLLLAGCAEAGTPTADAALTEEHVAEDRAGVLADPTSSAASSELDDPLVALRPIADGLTSPIAMAEAPDGSGRLFVVDQVGVVRVIRPEGDLADEPFLDLRDRIVDLDESYDERGLLGLAFHPNYADNRRLFVAYSAPLRSGAPSGWDNTTHLSEFRMSSDPMRADPSSERVLLRVDQPQSNHAGGTVAFGPDGHLYFSVGDGGGANDTGLGHPPLGNGQETDTLLGSILRIDVDSGDPYGIPADNPFADADGADEIYAYGFRNPYRFSFDLGGSKELFAGDAGQNLFEEVSLVERGGNYGWRIMEGAHCFDVDSPGTPQESCAEAGPRGRPLRPPVIEYSHDEVGLAVVGGHVYRGDALPELAGAYVFGDWSRSFGRPSGTLLAAFPSDREELWPFRRIRVAGTTDGGLGHYLLGFGQSLDGEMYVLVKDEAGPAGHTGQVLRLAPPG